MTTQRPANWQSILEARSPELFRQLSEIRETIMADGALSLKIKTLMTMLCDALLAHPEGMANITKRARSLGASDTEITETIGVAFLMGGLPGLVTGANAFRD
jgi:alkylhydroperoxidase/carboxymuconolactone decarboxylase family protein YurZ